MNDCSERIYIGGRCVAVIDEGFEVSVATNIPESGSDEVISACVDSHELETPYSIYGERLR